MPPEAEVSFERWRDLLHPEDRPRLLAAVPQFIEEGGEQKEEYRVLRPDGSVRWLLVRGAVTRDAAGRPVQMVGIAMDITERRTMEEALRRAKVAADAANRAKSEFLANMSHEIRTPLTVTMGTIELLQDTVLNEEQRHYLEMAQSASENLLRLIEDLLDFSRLEAGRMAFRQEPFDVRGCVQTTVQAFSPEAQRKGLRLALEIDPGVPGILVGDADRLRQVLFNLVDNAIKFTERGEVTVTVGPDPEIRRHLVFTVWDTGIGIPGEKLELLFQAFTQLDSSPTRRHGGTGLGLILSKRLLARMGGSIRVESTPGQGSQFSFSLPLLAG